MKKITTMLLPMIALLLLSCEGKPSAPPNTAVKPQEQRPSAAETEAIAHAANREKWLLSASAIFPPNAPRSSVTRILGSPDRELPEVMIYHLSQPRTGRVHSVHFKMSNTATVEKVEYLDAKGEIISISKQ